MEFASTMGVEIINTHVSNQAHKGLFFKNITKLAKDAENIGLIIGLENSGADANDILSTGRQGARLVEKIGSDNIKINYDFGNVVTCMKGEVDPMEDLLLVLPHTIHLHFKALALKNSGYMLTEIGKGLVDYRKVIKVMNQRKTACPIGVELPLRFRWDLNFTRTIAEPPPLKLIRNILHNSLEFIQGELSAQKDS